MYPIVSHRIISVKIKCDTARDGKLVQTNLGILGFFLKSKNLESTIFRFLPAVQFNTDHNFISHLKCDFLFLTSSLTQQKTM